MPKPTTRAQFLAEAGQEREKLLALLRPLTPEQKTRPGIVGDWSVKDVLGHLVEWHQMVLCWLAASRRGETPAVPAQGYNWGMLPELNQVIYEQYRAVPLDEMEARFAQSDRQTRETVEALDEEMLFTPGLYPWMNKNTLLAYFNSNMTSHYRWAIKEIRKGLKSQQG